MNNSLDDEKRRFGGVIRLYGRDGFLRLQKAHVAVIGLGGVGSWAAEALARTAVGRLTLVDLDHVALSNMNRQLHALDSTLGMAKTTALSQRIAQINPRCQVVEIDDFVSQDNLTEVLGRDYDFVIDAIDQTRVKATMAAYCLQHHLAFAVSGSAGGLSQPQLIQVADLQAITGDRMLANMRYQLRRHYGASRDLNQPMRVLCVYSKEKVMPPVERSCSDAPLQGLSCAGYGASMVVTASFGLRLAALAINTLIQDQ